MISLQLKIDPLPLVEPLVVRLLTKPPAGGKLATANDAMLVAIDENFAEFDVSGFSLRVHTDDVESLNEDVVMVVPGRDILYRLIRSQSPHNTFLITEQCDQTCIMCSQPPKAHHTDMFDSFLEAIKLAPDAATIGLSGGEPFLHKTRMFEFLINAQSMRPDITFHILTNGQHFDENDIGKLSELDLSSILWGIPIYAADAEVHNKIVAKSGAFELLQENLSLLGKMGALIELRTVVLNSNVNYLEDLALHISTHQAFADCWAIMQLENIGYARMNWAKEFYDNSVSFDPIGRSLDIASAKGATVYLYNFPLCSAPVEYRHYCMQSISDWKQKYLAECSDCNVRSSCAGFFEWYPDKKGFKELQSQ